MSDIEKFFVGIKAVIIQNNKILLVRTNAGGGRGDRWEMPGGRIEQNQTISQTLNRELTEELPNITNIQIHEILHADRLPGKIIDDVGLVLVYYRVGADFQGDPQLSDEHIDWQWADQKTASNLSEANQQQAIKQAFFRYAER